MSAPTGRDFPAGDALARLLLETLRDYAVFALDAAGRVQSWSGPAERLLGFTEPEVLGRSAERFYTPEDAAQGVLQQELRQALAHGRDEHDRWYVRRDGSHFWSGGVTTALLGPDGTPRGFAKIMRDRTELLRAGQARDEALTFADGIVATVREPLLVLDGDLRVQSANAAFYRTFQVAPSETLGAFVYALGNGQWNIPRLRTLLDEVLAQQASFEAFEVAHDFPDIGPKVMLLNARRLRQQAQGTELILLAIEDLTERRRLEAERFAIESRFTSLVKNVKDHSIFTLDNEGRVTTWNVAAEQVLGYTEAEVLGRHFAFIFTAQDLAQGVPQEELDLARRHGRSEDERWHLRKGGERFWASGIVSALHDLQGRPAGFAKILRDATQRKRDEEALRSSEQRYRLLFENQTEGFALAEMIWDDAGRPVDWRYLEVNPAWAQTGVSPQDTVGRRAREVNPAIEPYWIETYAQVVRTGEPVRYENYAAGFGKWFETFAFRHSENRFALFFRDVTERVGAAQALAASEARLRKVVSTPTVGVLFYRLDGRIHDANAAFERMCGHGRDELRGLAHWQALTAPAH